MKLFISGAVMFFGAIWLGPYLVHLAGGAWWNLPVVLTSIIVGAVGFSVMVGCVDVVRGPR